MDKDMSWARATLLGIAGMAGAGAFGILLRLLGFLDLQAGDMSTADMIMLVLFVLAVIPLIVLPILALHRIWLSIIAVLVLPMTPFALMFMTKVQPFGPIPALALAEVRAPAGIETGIRITDAAPRRDLARSVVFGVQKSLRRSGGSVTDHYQYQVAPVVPAQWVPGMPVRVWAVVEGTARNVDWDSPSGALFRPMDIDFAELAVRRFRAETRLPGPAETELAAPVIALWVADAGAARLDQVTLWAQILGGASLAWALLVSLGMLFRPPRDHAVRKTAPKALSAKLSPRWKRRPR